jgi:hypothetical protein
MSHYFSIIVASILSQSEGNVIISAVEPELFFAGSDPEKSFRIRIRDQILLFEIRNLESFWSTLKLSTSLEYMQYSLENLKMAC